MSCVCIYSISFYFCQNKLTRQILYVVIYFFCRDHPSFLQRQKRMSLLRSMMTYHMKPAKTRNKESFRPIGPIYTRG
jgi:hypothetical protein